MYCMHYVHTKNQKSYFLLWKTQHSVKFSVHIKGNCPKEMVLGHFILQAYFFQRYTLFPQIKGTIKNLKIVQHTLLTQRTSCPCSIQGLLPQFYNLSADEIVPLRLIDTISEKEGCTWVTQVVLPGSGLLANQRAQSCHKKLKLLGSLYLRFL
jgi:hypothetical protein